MAQLRQDYQKFVDRDAQVVVVGPDSQRAFRDYWRREDLHFVGLADPTHTVGRLYGQESRLLKLGRLPALMVVDKTGRVVYKHYGSSMSDIPPTRQILAVLDELNQEMDRSG
jgi:peroxiredoxin Q/BCP